MKSTYSGVFFPAIQNMLGLVLLFELPGIIGKRSSILSYIYNNLLKGKLGF